MPLYNENLFHFNCIPIEVFQLTGQQFETYREFIQNNQTYLAAIECIYSNYRCSGGDKFQPQYYQEHLDILMQSGLLLDEEREEIIKFYEKVAKTKKKELRKSEPTYIYLMKDERTELTKIGRSVNPSFRERTLQSDNPMIVLVGGWLGVSGDEKVLHGRYADRRFRGEWFDLSEENIQEIFEHFADRETWEK